MKRTLKYILLSTVLLLAILCALIFIPKVLVIKEKITIDAPARIVFNQINDFHNWNFWSELIPDKESAVGYGDGGMGKGGSIVWEDSNGTGIGKYTIISSVPYKSLEIAMDDKDDGVFSVARIVLTEIGEKTEVFWELVFKNKGVKSHIFKFDASGRIRGSLRGLAQVSTLWYEQNIPLVELGFIDKTPYVSIRRQIPATEAGVAMGDIFEQLVDIQGKGVFRIAGEPFAIYYSLGEERLDVECGFVVENAVADFGVAKSGVFAESLCAIVRFSGDYADIESAHDAIRQWLEDRNFQQNGPPMETFNNNFLQPAAAEWGITICYPFSFE
ncbi:MAG: SRPBCC family protein [Prolixibacteraceae bacterium]|nr:SRPBCC family protein [Prolixibacteraceae bacterium]